MTRHHFTVARAGRAPLSVTAGWDWPCGHFFLNVTDPNLPEDAALV